MGTESLYNLGLSLTVGVAPPVGADFALDAERTVEDLTRGGLESPLTPGRGG